MLFDEPWKRTAGVVSKPVEVQNRDDLAVELERVAYLAVAKRFSHQNEYIIERVKALEPHLSMDWSWLLDRDDTNKFRDENGHIEKLNKQIKANNETISLQQEQLKRLIEVYEVNANLSERIIELEQALREVGKRFSERNEALAKVVRAQAQMFRDYLDGKMANPKAAEVIRNARLDGVDFSSMFDDFIPMFDLNTD